MKSEPVVLVFGGDVLKEILVGGDSEGGWPVSPFDAESAVGFNFRKIGDWTGVGDHVAVSRDSANVAAGDEKKPWQECDAKNFHGDVLPQ